MIQVYRYDEILYLSTPVLVEESARTMEISNS